MKKVNILLYVAAAIAAASCAKELENAPAEKSIIGPVTLGATLEQQTVVADDTKTALGIDGDKYIINWSAGDQLSVLSSENPTAGGDCFTLVSGENTTNGQFDAESIAESDLYYALFPYDETASYASGAIKFHLDAVQTYVPATETTPASFGIKANPAVAMFTQATKDGLQFKNICSVFRLSLTSASAQTVSKIVLQDNNGKTLWGDATLVCDDAIGTDAQTLTLENGNNTITLDCSQSTVTLGDEPTDFYFIVPAGSFDLGFTAYVYSGDNLVFYVPSIREGINTTRRSRILAMPSIPTTPAGSIYDLSFGGTKAANSYVAPVAGTYKFLATEGNDLESKVSPASVGVIWTTNNTTTAVALNDIVSSASVDGNYIRFSTTGTPGNAVIAAFDNDSNILWSWHVWCSGEYIKVREYPVECKVRMMDRNMGALSCNPEDGALCSGFNYQWGRKDPFVGAGSFTEKGPKGGPLSAAMTYYDVNITKNDAVSATTLTAATVQAYANAHPTTFITQVSGDSDWYPGHNAQLWIPEKTKYDPCPVGYRIPDKGAFWLFFKDKTGHWSCDINRRGFVLHGTEWYPENPCKYRLDGTYIGDGNVYDEDTQWWCCSSASKKSYYFNFKLSLQIPGASAITDLIGNGYSVRCCVDKVYE